ncbi:hypothetical protein BDU57DRAFT_103930 [Ampelomyces quisqualis]|uniref:Uncharacterized protein n=1 Tax=Ampelomyces quisqualis TaxID=50730 RepID=A0A6A5Q9M8_AMPQU|nr:hypothetical protein BDU57DRAFT_103930 [Ampelomyces quisqualis]
MSDKSDFDGSGTLDHPMLVDGSEGSFETMQDGDNQPVGATSDESKVAQTIQTNSSTSATTHTSSHIIPAPSANASAKFPAPAAALQNSSVVLPVTTQAGPIVPGTVGLGPGDQYRRVAEETFTLDPNDSNWIIARLRVENPYAPGTYHEQVDRIPVMDSSARSPDNPDFYFIPDLKSAKIPMRHRASMKNSGHPDQWVRQPDSDVWTRRNKDGTGTDVWRPTILFRRFNETTNKYEEIYMNKKKLANVDPNEKLYQYGYNKWIDQIIRRRDSTYVKVVHKDHWSIKERQALFSAVNDYVRRNGLRRFGFDEGVKMSKEEMQTMTAAVNAVNGKSRQVDAVRSQIHSSHVRKNKAIFELLARAREMRERLARGEKVPRTERYPDQAIPLRDFPQEPRAKKRRVEELTDSDSDRDDQPPKADSPPSVALTGPIENKMGDINEADEFDGFWKINGLQPVCKHMRSNKKIKTEDASRREILSDDAWADTDEEIMSDAAEQAQEEAQWETCDEVLSGEDLEGGTLFEDDLQDNTPAEITTGISTPSVGNSDSGSDAEVVEAAQFLQRGKGRPQVFANASAPSPQQPKRKRGSDVPDDEDSDGDETSLSPQLKKRRHTPQIEVAGSDGDDEQDIPSPFLRRAIRKTRVART